MGTRVSQPELVKKLNKLWSGPYKKERYLSEVEIYNNAPLRGISEGTLKFEFPVSVITGANGAGKTTFTALSVLAFHAAQRPSVPLNNIEYFDFSYFFKSSAKERLDQGIQIGWRYTDGHTDWIEKGSQRWMRYIRNSGDPRRPVRGTEFIGISRIVPAFEKKGYHGYFADKKYYKERANSDELNKYISRVMSKKYTSTSQLMYTNTAGVHKVHSYNDTHSSFNAGAGEECLSNILGTMLRCPEGSFVAIEEVEIGLHPRTLSKLVDVILEIAGQRRLQVLITSHSPEFLRACPKEALVLAERTGDTVIFTNQPNVEYAISRIGGASRPAANIVCEDKVAEQFISAAMSVALRAICPVVAFGGKDQLIERAAILQKSSPASSVVIVWDGEVPAQYITDAENKGFSACRLPGDLEPEHYIVEKLGTKEGVQYLVEHYKLTQSEAADLISELKSADDPHDVPYLIAEGVRLPGSKDDIIKEICRFIVHTFQAEFEPLVTAIEAACP